MSSLLQNCCSDAEGYCHRLLWIASTVNEIFGTEFVDALMATKRVILYDTSKHGGRPDVVKLTLFCYNYFKSHGVFITSNPSLTASLVTALSIRGIHAYGPVFDS